MDGRVIWCIVTLLWLRLPILAHPHRVLDSAPDNVTVLEGSRLSIEWHVAPSLKHKDILWCYFRRRPNDLVSWIKFVGWDAHSGRLNISTKGHVGWDFLTHEPCISGITRENVTPEYSGIYGLTLKYNQPREDEQVAYITVIQDADLEYSVVIDGKMYNGTARDTPQLPGDIELKQDKSLLVNVSAPWSSAITISRDDHSDIEHCEDSPCAVQLNTSESGNTRSQLIIRIESTIQGAESIELKLNATVQLEPPSSLNMLPVIILLSVLFGLVAIGSLLYVLKKAAIYMDNIRKPELATQASICEDHEAFILDPDIPLDMNNAPYRRADDMRTSRRWQRSISCPV